MKQLTTQANAAKKVTAATEAAQGEKATNKKNESLTAILETTADKRIKNLEIFERVCKKHRILKGKADELTAFLHSRDGLKEKIFIENSEGYEIEISNSGVINEVLAVIEKTLFRLLEESEKEVTTFIV